MLKATKDYSSSNGAGTVSAPFTISVWEGETISGLTTQQEDYLIREGCFVRVTGGGPATIDAATTAGRSYMAERKAGQHGLRDRTGGVGQ
jgi:hypothetical protein